MRSLASVLLLSAAVTTAAADQLPVEPPSAIASPDPEVQAVTPPARVAAADPIQVTSVPAMMVAGPSTVAPAVAEPAAEAPPVATGLRRRRDDDPAASRAYLSESGLTSPRGRATVELRAPTAPVGLLGIRYGVSDRLEISAGAVMLFDDSEQGVWTVGAKAQLWSSERAAVSAGLTIASDGDDSVYNPYLVGTACVTADCSATMSVSLNGLGADGEDTMPVLGGIGWAIGRKAQFVGEVHQTRDDTDSATVGFVGGRIITGRLALDGGLGFALFSDAGGGGLPFFGMSTRL